jgi:hypothetical protein
LPFAVYECEWRKCGISMSDSGDRNGEINVDEKMRRMRGVDVGVLIGNYSRAASRPVGMRLLCLRGGGSGMDMSQGVRRLSLGIRMSRC